MTNVDSIPHQSTIRPVCAIRAEATAWKSTDERIMLSWRFAVDHPIDRHEGNAMLACTLEATLDFTRLRTPPNHADTLVEPEAEQLARLTEANHRRLAEADYSLLDLPGAQARRQVRAGLGVGDDQLAIVAGHQPEFIHPGVWAKHVVIQRLAKAVGGKALNLVVDSDAPRDTALHIPSAQSGRLAITHVPAADLPAGHALELAAPLQGERLDSFVQQVRAAFGEHFERSLLPVYLKQLGSPDADTDWVDQTVHARRAVEASVGVRVDDVRISRAWDGLLLAEMIAHAGDFAASYNRALATYRRANRVRSRQRPIPDLHLEARQVELPVWVYRRGEPRRRLFVRPGNERVELLADHESLGSVALAGLLRSETARLTLAGIEGVRFRPRALALTLWARLFLADLFVHGIGGAKYDRITDLLIQDYFGITPPAMACVSATLRLDLPRHDMGASSVRARRHSLRDLYYNPQRYVTFDETTTALLKRRGAAVDRSAALRKSQPNEHQLRRHAFQAVREINDRILRLHAPVAKRLQADLQEGERRLLANQIADSRDYFFALFSRPVLDSLLDRLPGEEVLRL
ncbi:MAG: hypothetical protein GY842_10640 [bacterium]|nr:hypothetical protein [bacterium]